MDQEQISHGHGTENYGMMENELDIKEYRKKKTLELIDKYMGLIDNVFQIFDDNKEIEVDDEKDDKVSMEQKKLDKIKKRSAALEQVDVFLDKIASLEHHFAENKEPGQNQPLTTVKKMEGYTHPTKARAKT